MSGTEISTDPLAATIVSPCATTVESKVTCQRERGASMRPWFTMVKETVASSFGIDRSGSTEIIVASRSTSGWMSTRFASESPLESVTRTRIT